MDRQHLRSSPGLEPAEKTSDRQEEEWAARIREGSEQAFEHLFFAYHPRLCGFVANYLGSVDLAREIVQDVFLKIWERRADLTVQVSLKAYLYQAVRNRALDHLRHRRTRSAVEVPLEPAHDGVAGAGGVEEELSYRELVLAVREAVARLPERRQTAFVLHRQHGLSYDEIARVMDISPRTVEVHIGKALQSLRRALPGLAA